MSTISTTIATGITLTTSGAYTSPLTITTTGAVEPATGNAVVGSLSSTMAVVNQGTILGPADGIDLEASGSAQYVNNAGGLIQAEDFGVYVGGTIAEVVNSGTISSSGFDGVALSRYSGTLIDSGTISGANGFAAVDFMGGAGLGGGGNLLVLESGYSLIGGVTVDFGSINTLQLSGSQGAVTVNFNKPGAGFTNFGTVAFGPLDGNTETLEIANTNGVFGTVTGFTAIGDAIYLTGLRFTGHTEVPLQSGNILVVSEGSSVVTVRLGNGTYTGMHWFATSTGIGGTEVQVAPSGGSTISTTITHGVTLATSGSYTAPLTITPTGAINAPNAVPIYGIPGYAWTVANQGTVATTIVSFGVFLHDPGYAQYVNNAGGLIEAGVDAVEVQGDASTVVNSGIVLGGFNGFGVQVYGGGTVVNNAGLIKGDGGGIDFQPTATNLGFTQAAGAVINAGTIIGEIAVSRAIGVYLQGGGSVGNTGLIEGYGRFGDIGVYIKGATGTVTNSGTIINGIASLLGVNLTNTGLIQSRYGSGVVGATSVTNSGTIGGDAGAPALVFYGTAAHLLVLENGYSFSGSILVAGTINTLELSGSAGAVTVNFDNPAAGFTNSSGGFTNFDTVAFGPQAGNAETLQLSTTGVLPGVITGFTFNDTIDLAGFYAVSATYASGALTLTNASNATTTLSFSGGPFNTATANITTNGTGTVITELCYVAGTRIAAPSGEVFVEQLAVGDLVVTHRGEAKPIVWIGKGKVLATRGRRSAATPVIVRKGALADNVPHRDLHVTKGHSLYLDDVLIPVEFLVNHRSIVWDDRAQEVEIYHIELATHDVLVANGAPAESYRDDGNRWLFRSANAGWQQPAMPPCAPLLTGGPVVDAVWRRLLDRAGPRPGVPTTDEPDLHLLVDGKRLDGQAVGNGVHAFRLTKPPISVRVASRAAAQDELGQARDPRLLGVALRQVVVWQGRHLKVMEADDPLWSDGCHAFEPDNGFRWTDGDALLPASLFDGIDGVCEIELHVACTTRYRLSEDHARMAA